MIVLVTGGAGYIGSVLTKTLLEQGHTVCVLDKLLHGGTSLIGIWAHPRLRFVKGDIRRSKDVQQAVPGVDAVVHLAAIVGDPACARDPVTARETNIEGSRVLLDASASAGVGRVIFASTCSNYGRMSDPTTYVDETSELKPISLYAETKVAIEHEVKELWRQSGIATTALRFSTIYGVSPRMRFDLTVNEFTAEAIVSRKLVVFGEQFWRPYIHVLDAAAAIAMVLEAPPKLVAGRVYNVGHTAENYRKQDIVDLVLKEVPGTEVEYVPKQDDPRDYRVSFERIRQELGFMPGRRVRDGIRDVAMLVRSGIVEDVHAGIFYN